MPIDPLLSQGLGLPLSPLMPGLFMPHRRSIGGIFARVSVEESTRDEVTTTQHPVEQGAPIADHAFKQPVEVTIRCGWNLQDGDLSAESGVYGVLLGMQASFLLFNVVTGKRIHRNMLINSIVEVTDQHSEYVLMLTLGCREIILTRTETAQVSSVGSNNTMASPSVNGSTENRGIQQVPEITGNTQTDNLIEFWKGVP